MLQPQTVVCYECIDISYQDLCVVLQVDCWFDVPIGRQLDLKGGVSALVVEKRYRLTRPCRVSCIL